MTRSINDTRSSLNEIDNEMKKVLLELMQIADTRVDNGGNPFWNEDRIFMTTSDSVDEIKMSVQLQSGNSSLSFPFLAYSPDKSFVSVDHAMGNRVNEAGLVVSSDKESVTPTMKIALMKSYQSKYTVSIWDDTFRAIRYYQDKIALRGIHREFCHEWDSSIVEGEKAHFTYLVGMPVINTVASASEKVSGSGYMYCLAFDVDIWGVLLDEPVTEDLIYQISNQFAGLTNKTESVTAGEE